MTIGNEDELEKLKAAGALVARTLQAMGQALEPGSQGIRPNRLKIVVGSGADRSLMKPTNGAWRMSMLICSTLKSAKNTGI